MIRSRLLVSSLLFAALLSPLASYASDTQPVTPAVEVAPPAKPATVAPKADIKDQALAFILSKAEKYSGKVEDAVGAGVDAAMREGPIVIAEYLKWHAWKAGVLFFAPLLSSIVLAISTFLLWRKGDWCDDDGDPTALGFIGAVSLVGAVITGAMTLASLDEILNLIQILVAPRVYLIEAVSHLIRA